MDDQYGRRRSELDDGREVANEIVRQVAIERRVRRVTEYHEHHGVAVGRRFRSELGADVARRARAVVHDHLLADDSARPVATMREIVSDPLPGENGTMKRIGLAGYC